MNTQTTVDQPTAGARYRRVMLKFRPAEYDVLRLMSDRERRPLQMQAELLLLERLAELGLYQPEVTTNEATKA